MPQPAPLAFDQGSLFGPLSELDAAALDLLEFGVIGFDAQAVVQRYNRWESSAASLNPTEVLGQHLFGVVAPCMNNYLVAQRFEDSAAAGTALDETVDYALTLRMKPLRVKLRLLAEPGAALSYVCIDRRP
jgi:photoactive yellow protein